MNCTTLQVLRHRPTIARRPSVPSGGRRLLALSAVLVISAWGLQLAAPATAATAATGCKHPFVTSKAFGGRTFGRYYIYNNMWNASGYDVKQTLYACSSDDWHVIATANNDSGNGAVKTYPDIQANFHSVPIRSFSKITSTFAETDPHVGIYEDAYDMWINGEATSSSTEVMIWTENFHQVPGPDFRGAVTIGKRTYDLWASGNSYIAFVATKNFTSGTLNILSFYRYIMSQHWIRSSSVLDAIEYGVEIVSTNSKPADFSFTNFSVTAKWDK